MYRRTALKALAVAGGVSTVQSTVAQADGYGPLGRVSVPQSAETVVSDDGQTAFVATQDGFAIVSLSDPTAPTVISEVNDILGDRESGPLLNIQDVKISGDRLIVAGPANSKQKEVLQGIAMYDISSPADPTQTGFYETTYPIHNSMLHDGIAYLTGFSPTSGGDIHMIDVTGDTMTEVAAWTGPDLSEKWTDVSLGYLGSPHDVWVHDDIAYVPRWDTGTWIVDVSSPTTPKLLSHIGGLSKETYKNAGSRSAEQFLEPPGNHHYARTSPDGSVLAIGIESQNVQEDQSEPNDTGGSGGIKLYDISDKTDPEKLTTIPAPESYRETTRGLWTTSHNFDIRNNRLYTSWYQGGVQLFDISTPTEPKRLAWWRKPDTAAFWTAQYATEEFFVAGLVGSPRLDSEDSGLYTFPNEPGTQTNPPSLTETPTPLFTPTPTKTASPSSTRSPTPSEVQDATEQSPTRNQASDTDTTATTAGGFGVVTSALAGGIAALRWLSTPTDSSTEDHKNT